MADTRLQTTTIGAYPKPEYTPIRDWFPDPGDAEVKREGEGLLERYRKTTVLLRVIAVASSRVEEVDEVRDASPRRSSTSTRSAWWRRRTAGSGCRAVTWPAGSWGSRARRRTASTPETPWGTWGRPAPRRSSAENGPGRYQRMFTFLMRV